MRSKSYLVDLVRDSMFVVLKRYIPPNLFMETNLPPINVTDPRPCDLCREGQAHATSLLKETPENPQLALSLYIPGRPLYRVKEPWGTLIPFRAPTSNQVDLGRQVYLSCIDNHYQLEPDSDLASRIGTIINYLPEEYKRFLSKLQITSNVNVMLVNKISPECFKCPCSRCHHWYFGVTRRQMYTYSYTSSTGTLNIANIVKKLTKSFGRYYYILVQRDPRRDLSRHLTVIHSTLRARPEVGLANALRLLYAVDYTVYTWRFKNIPKQHCINVQHLQEECSNKQSESKCKVLETGIFEGIKIPVLCNGDVLPVVMGYKIKDTHFIELDYTMDQSLTQFVKCLLKDFEDVQDLSTKTMSLGALHRLLTLNSVIVNMLHFIVSNELHISALLRNYTSIDASLRAAITYYDLRGSTISSVIRSRDHRYVSSEIVNRLIEYLCSLCGKCGNNRVKDPLAVLVSYFFKGEHKIITSCKGVVEELKPRKIDLEKELAELVDAKGQEVQWQEWILRSVLEHVLTHHLIARISAQSRTPSSYLAEIYEPGFDVTVILETMSGGIGAIETSLSSWLNAWENSPMDVLRDLLLTLGTCRVGTAEDLVYYGLIQAFLKKNTSDPREVKKAIREVAVDLGVIALPEELEEAEKVLNVLISEASKLASIIKVQPAELLKEAVRLRFNCETTLQRYCSLDELALFLVKSFNKYRLLKDLALALLERALRIKKGLVDSISKVYNMSDPRKLSEKFLDEVVLIANKHYTDNILADLIMGKSVAIVSESEMKRVSNDARRLIVVLASLIRSVLIKLALKSCDDGCGYCYVNQHSCRYGASFAQKNTLSRRLAKLYATYLLENNWLRPGRPSDIAELFGKVATQQGPKFITIPSRRG